MMEIPQIKDQDIEILKYTHAVLASAENQGDINPKQSQECAQKVLELQKQIQAVREKVKALPGIDLNKQDQLQKLENLRTQLVLKQELIKKYKDLVIS